MLHKKFSEDSDLFIGAVEQTANGIWLDKDVKDKDGIEYKIPIINVAESKIKKDLESPLIGKAVSKNIELMINKSFQDISRKSIGIIGLGSTGMEVARGLAKTGAKITIFDAKPERIDNAKNLDFIIGNSTIDTIKNNDIIIEATGNLWETDERKMRKLILSFRHGSYFFSGSSKRLGINHDILEMLIVKDATINIPGFGKKYKLIKDDKEIIMIADGFPVNFFLGESVPDNSIAFILAWLYKSAEIVAINYTAMPKGIIDTNDSTDDKWGLFKAQNEIRNLDEDLS
jgi:S-adenosylhomocysteine hydrolase